MPSLEEFKDAIRSAVLVRRGSGAVIIDREEGGRASWLFDFRALLLQPKWIDLYAELFWQRYADRYPFQVCGMETAAISLVTAIVMKGVERGTPVNGFFIRKSRKRQGLMKQIEGTLTDDPVILVDDLINSGGTFDKQIQVLEEAGKRVTDIFTLLAFRDMSAYEFSKTRGIAVSALFVLTDFGIPLLSSTAPEIPRESFETVWHFKAPDPSFHWVVPKSSPVLDDERVYVGTDAGTFYALDQKTGDVVWTFKAKKHPEGKGIFSSPTLLNSVVYFGAYDGNVYALDANTGHTRWIYDDADWVGSSPALAPEIGLLFIGLEFGLLRKRGGIIALSLATGKKVWEKRTPEYTHGSPLYIPEENLVVVGSNDGVAYGYDAKNGELRWAYATNDDIKSSFAYDPKRRLVICGSFDGKIYALSARDGTPLFAWQTGAALYSTPLVLGDIAVIASLDKHLYAIDLDTGKLRWSYATNGRMFTSPILAENSLWIGSNDGRLYEIDPEKGTLRSFFQATERIVGRIAYNPKTKRFFVPTVANEVYCLQRK